MDQTDQMLFDMVVPTKKAAKKKQRRRAKKKRPSSKQSLEDELLKFDAFGKETVTFDIQAGDTVVPTYVNEYWTARQRQANNLHEVSYRACFKPQLPRFFIERLTEPGDVVYDPFMGRGTTLVESALLGRVPMGCDINPLSALLTAPRLQLADLDLVEDRLKSLDLETPALMPEELLHFYHPNVLTRLCNLRQYLLQRRSANEQDATDAWIQMVATNRLTGHSSGFFSVYTLPPNQAVSVESQIKINTKREQTPPDRDVIAIILKKSKALLKDLTPDLIEKLPPLADQAVLLARSCDDTPDIPDASVSLVVTSPPFLKVVAYETDNWLRCWFNGIDPEDVDLWQISNPDAWQVKMTSVFHELHRLLKPGGHVAFEVGEVSRGTIRLEERVIPAAMDANLEVELVLINDQNFTKTSNCWGVSNQSKGTNTNRIVLLKKPA